MFKEFKEFISRGNVMDMEVGVVVGGAFTAIVNSLVKDIITPIIGIIMGGIDFSTLIVKVGEAEITYGNFIQAILNFLIVAFVIFQVVRAMNKMRKKQEEAPAAPPEPPKPSDEAVLLKEIKELLEKKQA